MITIFWLIIVAVMLVIEIFTMGLTTIWFSIGAVAAAIGAAVGAPLWVQIVLFCAISIIIMLSVRPFAMKVINKERTKTNIDEIVGKEAVVIEEIQNQQERGKVRFRDVEWMARSESGDVIPIDEVVTVVSISGVKLIVTSEKKATK